MNKLQSSGTTPPKNTDLEEKITSTIHLTNTQDNIEHIQTLNALIAPYPEKIRAMHKEGLFTPLHLACSLNIAPCISTILSVLTPEMTLLHDMKGKTPFFYVQSLEAFSLLMEKLASLERTLSEEELLSIDAKANTLLLL